MPTATTITLSDGQAVPVAHDFNPISVSPALTVYHNTEADTSAGQMQLMLGLSFANSSRKTNRATVRFNLPVEHTVDGIVRVDHTARFSCEIVMPEQMTKASRDDLQAYISNIFQQGVVQGLIADLAPVY